MREAQTVVFYSHTPKLLHFAAKLQWDSFKPYSMQILGKRRRLCGSYIKRGMCECVIVEGKMGGGVLNRNMSPKNGKLSKTTPITDSELD